MRLRGPMLAQPVWGESPRNDVPKLSLRGRIGVGNRKVVLSTLAAMEKDDRGKASGAASTSASNRTSSDRKNKIEGSCRFELTARVSAASRSGALRPASGFRNFAVTKL